LTSSVTLQDLVTRGRADLERAGISDNTAAFDAELLARHALGWDRATWLTHRTSPADASFMESYASLIARRSTREPVAYIRGVQEFWGREFRVTPAVLIPRAETELVIEIASEFLAQQAHALVVDIGTGSGCLAITLALEHPSARIYATDISHDALHVAEENAARLGASHVRFTHGAYLSDIPPPIDLIITNPPYVAATSRRALPPEVEAHEPAIALFGGTDGFDTIIAILDHSEHALAPGGRLVMEIGYGQDERLEQELETRPRITLVKMREDLQGIPRVAVIQRTSPH
jgi:release factor glutamine methyltransferase